MASVQLHTEVRSSAMGALDIGRVLVDVGGTWTRVRVPSAGADRRVGGDVLSAESPQDPDQLVELISAMAAQAASVSGCSFHEVRVAMPGLVDREGFVHLAGNLRIRDFPLRDALERATGRSCIVVNDAKAQALAVLQPGHSNMIYVAIGTGVGGALVVDGHLVVGSGFAGEIGHMQVPGEVDVQGAPCFCGRSRCIELVASAGALERRLGKRWWTEPSAAADGVLTQAGAALGWVLDSLAVALQPTHVHIASSLMHQADFRGSLERALSSADPSWPTPAVVWHESPSALTFQGLRRLDQFLPFL